jgi:hypothetical protein
MTLDERQPLFYLNGRLHKKITILTNSAAHATQQPKIYWHNNKMNPNWL